MLFHCIFDLNIGMSAFVRRLRDGYRPARPAKIRELSAAQESWGTRLRTVPVRTRRGGCVDDLSGLDVINSTVETCEIRHRIELTVGFY